MSDDLFKPVTFAFDYDGTWTADPHAFAAFARLLRARGHRVIEREAGSHVDRVVFSGADYKREVCNRHGETVSAWIDDMPEMIGPEIFIIGGDARP